MTDTAQPKTERIEVVEMIGAQALDVYDETGLTPRQLVEQRDELQKALRMYIKAGFGNSTDYYAQSDAYNAAIKALRAPGESAADLIAKVEAKP